MMGSEGYKMNNVTPKSLVEIHIECGTIVRLMPPDCVAHCPMCDVSVEGSTKKVTAEEYDKIQE